MNPTAIYSKTGKGIHEASGKTSALPRGDRAVLQAIDGRLTVSEVAKKAGKDFNADFEALIAKMDKDGFIREASAGTATIPPKPAATVPPAGKKPAAPAGGGGGGSELDFTSFTAPPRPSAPAAGGTLDFSAKPDDRKAKEADALKARMEAEAKAKAEAAARARADAEDKAKGEAAAKARAAAEAQARAAAEAKAKAARETQERAAAEARKKADAEAAAKQEAERKARADAAKETDDLKARLAEERKAREDAERKAEEKAKAQADALRAQIEGEKKALEEERRKIAEEKKRREEEEKAERKRREEEEARRKREEEEARKRREEEERAERKRREEEERKRREEEERAARKRREEEERRKKEEAERKKREEEEERRLRKEREEEEERAKRRKREEAEEDERGSKKEKAAKPEKAEEKGGKGDDFGDSLLADLDSFTNREEDERKERAAADQKEKEEARKRRDEEEARRKREDEERDAQRRKEEEKERKRDEERKAREDQEKRARDEEERLKREEQKRKEEEEERKRKAKSEESLAARSVRQIPAGESRDELERKRRQAMLAGAGAAARERRQSSWGKPVATVFFLLLVAGAGVVHVMPLNTAEYEKQASAALGHPVKIDSARMSLYNGVRINLEKVRVGDAVTIAAVRASPQIGTLLGDGPKAYSRLELEGLVVPQRLIADALFGAVPSDSMKVESIAAKQVKFEGPLTLPQLDVDAALNADGALRSVTVNGPDGLLGRLTMKGGGEAQFEVSAGGFPIVVAQDVTLSNFSMNGTLNRSSLRAEAWDGSILGGVFKGRANVRWGPTMTVQAESRFANINAAVFAPALLSDGRAEGNARFSLSGPPSSKLLAAGRVDGNFSILKGSLGSFDLSRIIQTQGSQIGGRTQFTELTGQAVYDNGSVTIRNVALTAGALNAGASLEVNPEGKIAGRVVADVRTPAQTLRAQLTLSGTVKEPQVNR